MHTQEICMPVGEYVGLFIVAEVLLAYFFLLNYLCMFVTLMRAAITVTTT